MGEQYPEEACVEGVEGSCYSLVVDRLEASWVVGTKKAEVEGLEEVQQAAGTHGGGMAELGVRSLEAWERRMDLLSSSWTADFGSLLQTCRSCWWT